jgi:hypothetical protein
VTDIHPIHHSIYGLPVLGRPRAWIKPRNMGRIKLPDDDMRVGLTQVALEIFADCTNVGVPFQDALLAIYLSGLQHAHEILRKDEP